jgi:hypothetical protein
MNERERWIVYPLLFFALGAALRDKFLQRVTTDELFAKHVICDELSVRDPAKDGRIVARLASGSPPGAPVQNADRFGVLALFDSEGRELCGVTNNALQVRQIGCDELFSKSLRAQQITGDELVSKVMSVVDPLNPQRRLALLTSANSRQPDGATRRVGSLLLTDDRGAAIFGLANDQMQMRNIVCQGIAVVAPEDQSRVLAVLGSAMVQPNDRDVDPQRVGVLQLNDQRLIGLTGDPTEAPVDAPPPPSPIEPDSGETEGSADEPEAGAVEDAEPAADGSPAGDESDAGNTEAGVQTEEP